MSAAPLTAPLTYLCPCGHTFPVLAEEQENGEWIIEAGESEQCPECDSWMSVCELDRDEGSERPDVDLGCGVTVWLI